MVAVTVRYISDLMMVVVVVVLPRSSQLPPVVSASALALIIHFRISRSTSVRGDWREHIFFHEHL